MFLQDIHHPKEPEGLEAFFNAVAHKLTAINWQAPESTRKRRGKRSESRVASLGEDSRFNLTCDQTVSDMIFSRQRSAPVKERLCTMQRNSLAGCFHGANEELLHGTNLSRVKTMKRLSIPK